MGCFMSNIKHPGTARPEVEAVDYNALSYPSASRFVNEIVYDHIDNVELQQSLVPPSPFVKS
jgi:hypothetical protein